MRLNWWQRAIVTFPQTFSVVKVKWSQLTVIVYSTITHSFVLLGNNEDRVSWEALLDHVFKRNLTYNFSKNRSSFE